MDPVRSGPYSRFSPDPRGWGRSLLGCDPEPGPAAHLLLKFQSASTLQAPPKLLDCPPCSRPEVVPPLSASLGGLRRSQSALPPPSLLLIPYHHPVFPLPCSLLPITPRISYFTPQNSLFSFLTSSSRVTYAPPSLALLNPSLHSLFSSLDFHFPSVFPSPSQSATQQTRFPSSPTSL